MDPLPPPLTFFLVLFSGWINRHQQAVIDYLLEENRVLRAVNGSRRLRLTDDQRRRLAVKGHVLGRRHRAAVAGIVTPDTILRWYRRLVARVWATSASRRRPRHSDRAQYAAVSGSAACSSSIPARPRNPSVEFSHTTGSACLRSRAHVKDLTVLRALKGYLVTPPQHILT
jgi:hypothetical protein